MIFWIIWAALGLAFELLAIYEHNDRQLPTLTHVLTTHVPRWLIGAGILWLALHFGIITP